jgi:hypothetical protein
VDQHAQLLPADQSPEVHVGCSLQPVEWCAGQCGYLSDPCAECACDASVDRCEPRTAPGCCYSTADCQDGLQCLSHRCSAASCGSDGACIPPATCYWGTCTQCTAGLFGDGCFDQCGALGECEECRCESNTCVVATIANCCLSDADCGYGYHCLDHLCTPGACVTDADCSGGCEALHRWTPCDDCRCNRDYHYCYWEPVEGDEDCCLSDADCDDGDPATQDACPDPGSPCSHSEGR